MAAVEVVAVVEDILGWAMIAVAVAADSAVWVGIMRDPFG